MVMIKIGFPDLNDEKTILANAVKGKDSKNVNFKEIAAVTNAGEIAKLKKEAMKITVSEKNF